MMNDIQFSFETHDDLAMCMCDLAKEANTVVYAVVFYEDVRKLLKSFGSIDEVKFGNIELEDPQWGGYAKEYYVYVDEDLEVGVEPAWRDRGKYGDACYMRADECIALIHSDANSKILEALKGCDCAEFEIEADAECDGCCEECAMYGDEDNDEECDYADIIEYLQDTLSDIVVNAICLF